MTFEAALSLQDWEHVKEILHEALLLPLEQRPWFLDKACGSNGALLAELNSLLAADQDIRSSFLQSPLPGVASPQAQGAGLAPGNTVAERFQIVRKLGEGGMGQVWLAQQTSPVRRLIALKLIKAGMYDEAVVQRFESERQTLAIMDHPAIAKVFDAGTTLQGQPYFVMEYVPGVPITQFCDQNKLTVRDRIELLIQACDGVQHAHQKAIVHRDLKPANILVIQVDGVPVPRIIDFGLAKLTSPRMAGETQVTRHFAGTPGYMSPEQADYRAGDIDTRTDVYSLGVVLYVLLTGSPPFDAQLPLDELLRKLREEEPPKPSARVGGAPGTEARQLARSLRGDLDWITMKALEKDRARRYSAPSELSADLRRYLRDEPVAARPASPGYQLRKYIRRHGTLVAGAAAVVLALAGGVVAATSQAIRANRAVRAAMEERDRAAAADQAAIRERNRAIAAEALAVQDRNRALAEKVRADNETNSAKAVTGFLQNDLLAQASAYGQARPNSRPDPDLKVRTALDRAADHIQGKFDKQPLVEASIRETIGVTYIELGIYPAAEPQLERSVELRRRFLGKDHGDTLTVLRNLAELYSSEGKYAKAVALYNKVLRTQLHVLGEHHPDTLECMLELAEVYNAEEKRELAESILIKVLDLRRRVLGEHHRDTLATMYRLGGVYQEQGKYALAEPLVRDALSMQRRILGEGHPETLLSMNSLASLYGNEHKYAQAESLYLEALAMERQVLGEEHRNTIFSLNSLAYLYDSQGKYAQAEPLYLRTLEYQRRVLGEEHSDTMATVNNLAVLYRQEGKYDQAEPLYLRALELQRRVSGEEHPGTMRLTNNLASLYAGEGKYSQAEVLFVKVFQIRSRLLGPEEPHTMVSSNNLAEIYELQGKYAQSEPLLTKTLELRRRVLGDEAPDTLISMRALGKLYRCEGKYAQAEPLLTGAGEAQARLLGKEDPQTLASLADLALLYRREARYAQADGLFADTLESLRRVLGPGHPDTREVAVRLAEVRLQQKRYLEAESLLRGVSANDGTAARDSWLLWWARSMLGAAVAAQGRFAEAEPLLVTGYRGLVDRKVAIAFENRVALSQAGGWIAELYNRWGKQEEADKWGHLLAVSQE